VNHSDSTTLAEDSTAWITMTSLQSKWLDDVANVLTFDEAELNTTIVNALTTTYYNATTIAVVTGTGQGAITDLQTHNSISYNVSEVDSDFDFRVNFTNVDSFNQLIYRYKSEVGENHVMQINVWDYDDSKWGDLIEEGGINNYGIFVYPILCGKNHTGDGTVQIRFTTTNGPPNTVHKWQFDWITISDGPATPSSSESDPFSVHRDGNTPLTADWDAGDVNITATEFRGNLNWTYLQNYPVACPANSAVTTIGDSNTCTDGLYTLANIVTNIGNWSADKGSYYTSTQVDTLGNWSADKASYAAIGTANAFTSDAANITAGTFGTGNYVFDGIVQVQNITLEQDTANHRIYDNATCVIITGDTSTLSIC